MKLKLFLFAATLAAVIGVEAQTCLQSVNYSNVCGASDAKSATATCLSGVSKMVGSSSGSCQTATNLMSQLNSMCAASGVDCGEAPPPLPSTSTFSARYQSKVVNGNLNSITFYYSRTIDPYECITEAKTYKFVLDKNNTKNTKFLKVVPSNQYMKITLTCPSAPAVSGTPNNAVYTFPSGCYVASYMAASPPSDLMCY